MDRRRSLALTAALAGLWLAVGYLNVARGAAHAGAGYRFWSFQHHCYSDVIALHGDRYLGGAHPLPYLEDRIEYPVLLGLALWLPSSGAGRRARALHGDVSLPRGVPRLRAPRARAPARRRAVVARRHARARASTRG